MTGFCNPHALAGLKGNESVLLALSGGADSSALLHMLATHCKSNGATLYAAHVDHMIREDEHDRDRDFCRRLAEKYGIRIFVLEADVPSIAAKSGESTELAARRVRYEYFAKLMHENSIPLLCTAHNADDNLETLIFNLTRGTGLRGMCGIPRVRNISGGTLVRPILDMTKDEILDYCLKNNLEYVNDSTNSDDAYARNRIRLHVIPELKRLNPEAAVTASRFCESVRLDYSFISTRAEELISPDGIRIKAINEADPSLAGHALSIAFEKECSARLETVHIDALLNLCACGKNFSSVSLPCKMKGRIENGFLKFSHEKRELTKPKDYEIELKMGKNEISGHILLYVSEKIKKNIYKSATRTTLDFDKIVGGLYARNRKPQDKIFLRGMHRDVRKLMSEKKIPPELRDEIPVVCDESGILFVPFIGARDGSCTFGSEKYIEISMDIKYTE